MNEDRILKLRDVLKKAVELAQTKNLKPDDLVVIKELWKEQEHVLRERAKQGDPTFQEMVLDLRIIDTTGKFLGQHIRQLQTSTTVFSPLAYADKLIARCTVNDELNWLGLSKDAVRIINRAPGIPMLLGTFSATSREIKEVEECKKKSSTTRVFREAAAEKQTPDQVENVDEDKDAVDVKVKHIQNILKQCYKENKNRPISFFLFVLHPTNFTITVENIFYISFIIRDGNASLDMVDGELLIAPMKKSASDEKRVEKNQMVFSIMMDEWESLVQKYNIRQPMIRWE